MSGAAGLLLEVLRAAPLSMRPIVLQTYIAEYGPIPDAMRADVVALLKGPA